MRDERCVSRRAGLTLIELIVVVTILALVTATVTVRLGGQMHSAAMGQALSQWEFTEDQLRSRARRSGQSVSLHLEIGSGRIELALNPEDSDARTKRSLARDVRITKFLSATREVNYGAVAIAYSDRGTTETFAIELSGRHEKRWLLVAGITGQMSQVKDEDEIKQLFERLLPKGLHAG